MTDVMSRPGDLRREFERALSPSDYHRLSRSIAEQQVQGLATLRCAVLSSYSAQFLKPYLVVEGARRGYALQPYFGAFAQFEQEVAASSALWTFAPDALVILMRPEDIDIDAVERFHATNGARFRALADSMITRLTACAKSARERMSGPILIANVAQPSAGPLGPFDANIESSLTHAIAELNRRLATAAASVPGTFVWDYAGLVRSRGTDTWTDPRLWAIARAAVASQHQPPLAQHLVRSIVATLRPPAKCLVLDLDNTLWGGVIGDDGPGGIQLGDDFPGNVFKHFQRAALALMDRGILLAVCSKNNPDIVEQTLRTHPEMVLRWDDFACVKANWRSKSENMREIAKELNIGIDALVLFDDNPVERAEVRAALPQVGIVEVPTDPLGYVTALRDCGFFDQPTLQAEDRERAAMYRSERERRVLADSATTPEEFLRSLEMEAEVGLVDAQTLGRVTQLINKTNQFNLTTRRYTEADVSAMSSSKDHVVAWLRLRDRFGDQGLIAVGIVRRAGAVAEIDTFLMSCRVMNRQVEHAFMAYLAEHARALGCERMTGSYIPTKKNGMVAEFYPDLGFEAAGTGDDGRRDFAAVLAPGALAWPGVIARR